MVRAANERSTLFYVGCGAWLAAVILLVRADFGVIAFVGTVLGSIWVFGLREKWDGEVSAYSVFNRDGKGIAGGFTAQQLDRQLRGGLARDSAEDDDASIPVAGSSTSQQNKSETVGGDEKERRRKAAAAAAERRFAAATKED